MNSVRTVVIVLLLMFATLNGVLKLRGGGDNEDSELKKLSVQSEVDTDSEFEETADEDGLSDAPFTGPPP